MVIAQAGRKNITSVEDYQAAAGSASPEKGLLMLVRSAQGSRFVVLKGNES
jgi:hypothetical protein